MNARFCLFIHLLLNIWVDCIFLAVKSDIALNIYVQFFFFFGVRTYVFVSLAYIPSSEIAETDDNSA